MASADGDFEARMKRVKARAQPAALHNPAQTAEKDFDENAMIFAVLRPQLALVLGAFAMIAGRAVAMNYLDITPSTELLGWGEGIIVLVLLFALGAMLGTSQYLSHGALLLGAALAFLGEGYYIPVIPDAMAQVYTPEYVGLVMLQGG